ncbi:MAG: hypothetical protein F4037_00510, partial [Gemmatimonadales bacterium]|nr:hypothetical protein [Candidatus Palauibacter ramosifaciens]
MRFAGNASEASSGPSRSCGVRAGRSARNIQDLDPPATATRRRTGPKTGASLRCAPYWCTLGSSRTSGTRHGHSGDSGGSPFDGRHDPRAGRQLPPARDPFSERQPPFLDTVDSAPESLEVANPIRLRGIQRRAGALTNNTSQPRGGSPRGGGGQPGGKGQPNGRAKGSGGRGGKGRNRRRRSRGRRNRGGQGSRQQGSRQQGPRQQRPSQHDAAAEIPEGPKDGYLGLIERLGNGTGFIRRRHAGYTPSDDDIYVSPKIVSRYDLRTGDE